MSKRRLTIRLFSIAVLCCGLAVVVGCGGTAPPAASGDSAADAFEKARRLYDQEKWDKAKLALEAVIFGHPGSAFVDSAQFMLAMSSYQIRDYIVAADEFRRLHSRYPNSALVEEADLLRSRSLLKIAPRNAALDQDKTFEAITELNLFKDNYPLSRHIASADSLLAQAYERLSKRDFRAAILYHRLGRFQAARIYFQQLIDNYTDSPYVPDALFHMAEGYRQQDSVDRAIEYYEKMLFLYPTDDRAPKAKKRIASLADQRDTVRAAE